VTEFKTSLYLKNLQSARVDDVDVANLFHNTLLQNGSKSAVFNESLNMIHLHVKIINGVDVNGYFYDVFTVGSRLSRAVTFDKILLKRKLVVTGTRNCLRASQLVNRHDKAGADRRFGFC